MKTTIKISHNDLFQIKMALIKGVAIAKAIIKRDGCDTDSYFYESMTHMEDCKKLLNKITEDLNLAGQLELDCK
jgi:hypothetical protein